MPERQAKYRERQRSPQFHGRELGTHRLRVCAYPTENAWNALRSLAKCHGLSRQAVINLLIETADRRILDRLTDAITASGNSA